MKQARKPQAKLSATAHTIKSKQTKRINQEHQAEISVFVADDLKHPTATKQTADTKATLDALADRRNALIKSLEANHSLTAELTDTVNALCDTIAQISVYKTLLKLADAPKDITKSGADMCYRLYRSFSDDMRILRTNSAEPYSDAIDLYQTAYAEIWQYLHTTAPLTLTDTVRTDTLKNGNEKNYTIFQTACKSIREYVHSWSKTDTYKRIHYLVGLTDKGEQVTTSTRPQTDIADIDEKTRRAFFNRYGLTAQQSEILLLMLNGEDTATISTLTNLPLRTVQDNIKKAKAKFPLASAQAELITAENALKLATAKAEKHPTDSVYQVAEQRAKDRYTTAKAEYRRAHRQEVNRREAESRRADALTAFDDIKTVYADLTANRYTAEEEEEN